MLGVCAHGQFSAHSFACQQLGLPFNAGHDKPLPPTYAVEPLAVWYTYAQRSRAVLSAVELLQKTKPPVLDHWRILMPDHSAEGLAINLEQQLRHPEVQWQTLSWIVSGWLQEARVRPVLRTARRKGQWGLRPELAPEHLFESAGARSFLLSTLAIELAAAVCSPLGPEICDGCGDPYTPNQRPKSGRRHYCFDCRESGYSHSRRESYHQTKGKPASQ